VGLPNSWGCQMACTFLRTCLRRLGLCWRNPGESEPRRAFDPIPVALWRGEALGMTVLRQASPVVLHAALVAYFAALRMAAQACDTPESAALLPGIVAQPPFSTYAACCHESVFFNAVRLSAAAALRWN
jgi:hypothetical protein